MYACMSSKCLKRSKPISSYVANAIGVLREEKYSSGAPIGRYYV